MHKNAYVMIALFLVGCVLSKTALAFELGDAKVRTSLNQPLLAEIPITHLNGLRKEFLQANLTSPDANVETNISQYFHIKIIETSQKAMLLRITSDEPIKQPIIKLTVNLHWYGNQLQQTYDLLFDLPADEAMQKKRDYNKRPIGNPWQDGNTAPLIPTQKLSIQPIKPTESPQEIPSEPLAADHLINAEPLISSKPWEINLPPVDVDLFPKAFYQSADLEPMIPSAMLPAAPSQ